MRYFFFVFLTLIFSCSKENSICYVCTTTYIVTTDQAVENYPATTTIENKFGCDVEESQVIDFENTTKGSDVAVIGGVTYSSSFSTKCVKN